MAAETDDKILVNVFWDLNKSELTEYPRIAEAPEVLVENIERALQRFNSRYRVKHVTACGYVENFIEDEKVDNVYAPERYCLCDECTKNIRCEHAWINNVNRTVYFNKEETPDLMLTRMIHMAVRQNRENEDVILLITGDPASQRLLMDIQRLGNIVLLAIPKEAETFVGFGAGTNAVWKLENLITGGRYN